MTDTQFAFKGKSFYIPVIALFVIWMVYFIEIKFGFNFNSQIQPGAMPKVTEIDFSRAYMFNQPILEGTFKELEEDFWERLHSKLAYDIKKRYESKKRRDGKLQMDVRNLAFNLSNPNCYHECRETNPDEVEIFICEGVSSGDFVKQERDSNSQAVFELTGKTKNTFKDGKYLYPSGFVPSQMYSNLCSTPSKLL